MQEGEDFYKAKQHDYYAYKHVPAVKELETPTFMRLLGKLNNEDVIDLGCGSGFYTKILRSQTSGQVYGVDISSDQIELAKSLDQGQSITYLAHDCFKPLPITKKFDVVACTFLLQHARSQKDLEILLLNIFEILKPGGRIVGLNVNVKMNFSDYFGLGKCGHVFSYAEKGKQTLEDGDLIDFVAKFPEYNINMSASFYYLNPRCYEEAFKNTGFVNFEFVPLNTDDGIIPDELKQLIENPYDIAYVAQKV